MRNALARTVAQIRTGHRRSAVHLKCRHVKGRTRERSEFCWPTRGGKGDLLSSWSCRGCGDRTDDEGARVARMDEWVAWDAVNGAAPRSDGLFDIRFVAFPLLPFVGRFVRDMRPAHRRGRMISIACAYRPRAGCWFRLLVISSERSLPYTLP
jgi:hypothetical protein